MQGATRDLQKISSQRHFLIQNEDDSPAAARLQSVSRRRCSRFIEKTPDSESGAGVDLRKDVQQPVA